MKYSKKACAALLAFLILAVPTVACSQKSSGQQDGSADSTAQTAVSGSSSRTMIVGKVTAVVGNQVTLAIGKLNETGSGKSRKESSSSEVSSSASSVSSAVSSTASESSSDSSSSIIALTGETQTILIPVGLTLSNGRSSGFSTRSGSSGSKSGSGSGSGSGSTQRSGSGGSGSFSGGSGGSGGSFGGSGGTTSRTSGSTGTTGTTTTQRSSDFSSITTGMILQIVEETLSDGTQGIVSVSELSK